MTMKVKWLYNTFVEKVRKADRAEIYICPVCDNESQVCDTDYQSLECELIEREILQGDYYENQETN
tara:strand:- start:399 stop:596 length:198 start_codon:yes stop_codon:yes gene_type:complete